MSKLRIEAGTVIDGQFPVHCELDGRADKIPANETPAPLRDDRVLSALSIVADELEADDRPIEPTQYEVIATSPEGPAKALSDVRSNAQLRRERNQ